MRIKILHVVAVLALAFLILSAVAGVFLAEATLHPGRNISTSAAEMQARKMTRLQKSELTNVSITVPDGVILRAWSIRPRNGNENAVILLHGLSDNRAGMTGYAELLLNRGFSVLLPDARAHGSSGGNLATFGLMESDDIHRWLDWMRQNDTPKCIFGLGESMGAALLLQSLRNENRFCAVVAESSFATFREIGYDRIGQFFQTGPWLGRTVFRPVLELAFFYARWKYKLNFQQISPENVVATTTVPAFLIHGQNDSNIPVRHSRLIAALNSSVSLWEVPKTEHCGAADTHPDEFNEKLIHWFESHESTHSSFAAQLAY
jgi:uncharacterized protein